MAALRLDDSPDDKPFLVLPPRTFNPSRVLRSLDTLPKQGDREPWRLRQNYLHDLRTIRRHDIDDGVRAGIIRNEDIPNQIRKTLGQTVLVENKLGAGGTVGASVASRASNDGYSLFMGAVHHTIAPSVYKKLSYDPGILHACAKACLAQSNGSRSDVTKQLFKVNLKGSILGNVSFNANGDVTANPVTIYKVKGGKSTTLKVIVPPKSHNTISPSLTTRWLAW